MCVTVNCVSASSASICLAECQPKCAPKSNSKLATTPVFLKINKKEREKEKWGTRGKTHLQGKRCPQYFIPAQLPPPPAVPSEPQKDNADPHLRRAAAAVHVAGPDLAVNRNAKIRPPPDSPDAAPRGMPAAHSPPLVTPTASPPQKPRAQRRQHQVARALETNRKPGLPQQRQSVRDLGLVGQDRNKVASNNEK